MMMRGGLAAGMPAARVAGVLSDHKGGAARVVGRPHNLSENTSFWARKCAYSRGKPKPGAVGYIVVQPRVVWGRMSRPACRAQLFRGLCSVESIGMRV